MTNEVIKPNIKAEDTHFEPMFSETEQVLEHLNLLPVKADPSEYFHYRKDTLEAEEQAVYEKEVELIKETPFVFNYVMDLAITDINYDGTNLFIEDNVKGFRKAEIQPTAAEVETFLNRLRNIKNVKFDHSKREMNVVLGYLRINAVHKRNNVKGYSFSIRMARPYKVVNELKDVFITTVDVQCDLEDVLQVFVKAKLPVLCSGETGAGKTEAQKAMIGTVAGGDEPDTQIVLVEDTPDSHIKQLYPNACIRSWTTSEEFTAEDAVREGMRNNPDIFMIAEIRGVEAAAVLDAVKTNHGLISTLHTLGALDTPYRLMSLIRMSPQYSTISDELLGKEIARFFPICMHMVKERRLIDGVMKTIRFPSEIAEITGFDVKNGFVGTYLYKRDYEYDETTEDYIAIETFNPLSVEMQRRIKNKRLFHELPKRFREKGEQ